MATITKTTDRKLAAIGLELQRLSWKLIRFAEGEEGEYRPDFMRRYRRARKSQPIRAFRDAKSFLKQVRGKHG